MLCERCGKVIDCESGYYASLDGPVCIERWRRHGVS
jgi:hypothetical protein